jgi:hypothetical protein
MPTASSSYRQIAVFVVAVCVAAFELGSFVYFRRASVDFIEAANIRGAPLYRLGDQISWQSQAPGAIFGWWAPDPGGTWSVGSRAAFEVRLTEHPNSDLQLHALATGFLVASSLPMREVDVFANETIVARWQLTPAGPRDFTAHIARSVIVGDRLRVGFHFDEAPSPVELGMSSDYRKLGIYLIGWRIDASP